MILFGLRNLSLYPWCAQQHFGVQQIFHSVSQDGQSQHWVPVKPGKHWTEKNLIGLLFFPENWWDVGVWWTGIRNERGCGLFAPWVQSFTLAVLISSTGVQHLQTLSHTHTLTQRRMRVNFTHIFIKFLMHASLPTTCTDMHNNQGQPPLPRHVGILQVSLYLGSAPPMNTPAPTHTHLIYFRTTSGV